MENNSRLEKATPAFKKVLLGNRPEQTELDDLLISHYSVLRAQETITLRDIHYAARHYGFHDFSDIEYFTGMILELDEIYKEFKARQTKTRKKTKIR